MQNYADFKLSTKVAGEFRRQLVGRTDITTLDNGLEIRNARWSRKKLRFTASYVLLSPLAQEQVLNAFYAANAQLLLFRFRDIGDYRAVDQPVVDRVPGTKNTVQLYRTYIAGAGASFARRQIQAIVSCTVTVKSTGAVIPGVLDKTMGKFTPSVDWPVEACLPTPLVPKPSSRTSPTLGAPETGSPKCSRSFFPIIPPWGCRP